MHKQKPLQEVVTTTNNPHLHVVKCKILDLKSNIHNARIHTKKQIRKIAESIKSFGFVNPILIDAEDNIVAGHGRVAAAKLLDMDEIPTICLDHLTDSELRAYILADNRLAELAGWDNDILAIEFQALSDMDLNFDITTTGFETAEIDVLLHDLTEPDPEDDLPGMDDTRPVKAQLGDIWALGKHRVACGDVRDSGLIYKLTLGKAVRMVFTDPPYNVPIDGHVGGLGKHQHKEFAMASGELSGEEFKQFLYNSLFPLAQVSSEGALHYICMDWRHISELQAACNDIYTQFINLCVWVKTNGGMGSFYRSQHELIFIYQVDKSSHINNVELGKYGRYRTNVWQYPGMNAFGSERDDTLSSHPTVKPVQLVADAIMDATNIGNIVLDGFLGAGTTLLAAERTGRVCYGIEIDPSYVDLAIRRWEKITGKTAKLTLSKKII